jgi:hypothetical protein
VEVPNNMDALDWLRKHLDGDGSDLLREMVARRLAGGGDGVSFGWETVGWRLPRLRASCSQFIAPDENIDPCIGLSQTFRHRPEGQRFNPSPPLTAGPVPSTPPQGVARVG